MVVEKNNRKHTLPLNQMEGYAGSYTGPYWSDGKFQESVEFGELDPQSELDYLSYLHDTAYAHYKDSAHREAADQLYNERAKELAGRHPEIIGNIVEYGNMGGRQTAKLWDRLKKGFSVAGPLGMLGGAIYFQGENMVESNKRMKGTYLKKERGELEKLYGQDPKKEWVAKNGYKWKSQSEKPRAERAPTNAGETKSEHTTTATMSKPKAKVSLPGVFGRLSKVLPTTGNDKPKEDKPSIVGRIMKAASQLGKEPHRKSQSARVQPENKVSHEALIDSQRKRLVNYRQLHAAAVDPNPGAHHKRKKKKGNLRKAVKIDPYLHLR